MKVGFIGGIHEDIIRLREAFALLENEGCESVFCLGDVVGFSDLYYGYPRDRNAHECIRMIKDKCDHAVIGNHDLFTIKKNPQNTTFKYPDNWYNLDIERRNQLSDGAVWLYEDESITDLSIVDKGYLNGLEEYKVLEIENYKVLISHYIYPNLTGDGVHFDPGDNGIDKHFDFMRRLGCDFSIYSHDLCDGARIFTKNGIKEYAFGNHQMPNEEFALNSSWVANGTSPNGVLLLDTNKKEFKAISLNTPPFECLE